MSRRTLQRAPSPHQAPPVSTATRRDLFGSMGALLLLTAAEAGPTKAAELDGELLAMCAEYVTLERDERTQREAMTEAERRAYDRSRPLPWSDEARHTPDKLLVRSIAKLPARTPEGLRAKASVLRWYYGGSDEECPFAWRPEDALLGSVLTDVLGRTGA